MAAMGNLLKDIRKGREDRSLYLRGILPYLFALGCARAWVTLAVAVPVVVVAAFLLLRLSQNGKLKGDAAIALLSSSALAIGVMTVSMTSGMNTDVNNYMFGSILSLSSADLRLSLILSAAVLALFVLCYPRIFAVTFDETFSRATGVHRHIICCSRCSRRSRSCWVCA